jgi:hypothetical protein
MQKQKLQNWKSRADAAEQRERKSFLSDVKASLA